MQVCLQGLYSMEWKAGVCHVSPGDSFFGSYRASCFSQLFSHGFHVSCMSSFHEVELSLQAIAVGLQLLHAAVAFCQAGF